MLQVVNRLGQPRLPHHIHSSCTSDNSNYNSNCKSNIQITIPIQVRNIQICCSNTKSYDQYYCSRCNSVHYSNSWRFNWLQIIPKYFPMTFGIQTKNRNILGVFNEYYWRDVIKANNSTCAQWSGNQRRFGQMWKCKRF